MGSGHFSPMCLLGGCSIKSGYCKDLGSSCSTPMCLRCSSAYCCHNSVGNQGKFHLCLCNTLCLNCISTSNLTARSHFHSISRLNRMYISSFVAKSHFRSTPFQSNKCMDIGCYQDIYLGDSTHQRSCREGNWDYPSRSSHQCMAYRTHFHHFCLDSILSLCRTGGISCWFSRSSLCSNPYLCCKCNARGYSDKYRLW